MFGKTQRGVTEKPNKKKQSLIPKWLGTLVVILLILSFAVALMLWKPWEPVQARNQINSEHYQEETNKDYRFYDLLPQQQVTPVPEQAIPESRNEAAVVIVEAPTNDSAASEATASVTGTVPAAPARSYILQVKSYTDPDSADARRAEIILNGLSADVVRINEDGQTWYRVISGPYDSQEAAIIAQQSLQNSGIDSIVVKR